nr:hypothetical protein [Rhizobium leguminosarum]
MPGGADAGEAMCTNPNIAVISFTDLPGAGRRSPRLPASTS